jgi:hypothetical protein
MTLTQASNSLQSGTLQPPGLLAFQPALAWTAMLGLALITVGAILGGAGGVLRYVFPAGALAVALLLYIRYPLLYVSYTWWIWFLTPFVRRLADWKAGYQEPSTILLAPYLVAFVAVLTFIGEVPKTRQRGSLPFILSASGIIYALLIGYINRSPSELVVPFLNWFTPLLFGLFLFTKWREYPAYSQTIRRSFLWMVLLTGAYGIYQYMVMPEWDASWLTNSGLTSSHGEPEPQAVRVFSTMNATGPFSVTILAGLMLLFSDTSQLKLPASGIGYLAFLLTQVRSSWLGWALGLLVLGTSLKPKLQMRLFITIFLMALCVIPLATIEPFGSVIQGRLGSFSNLEGDTSASGRLGIYETHLGPAIKGFMGLGLGGLNSIGETLDSAVIDTLYTLGWIGALCYVGGLLLLVFALVQTPAARSDGFASATRAIVVAVVFMLLFGNLFLDLSGMVLWGFLGIGMAANRYYALQRAFEKGRPDCC